MTDLQRIMAASAEPEQHLPEGARKAHLEKIAKTVSVVEAPPSEPQPAPTAIGLGHRLRSLLHVATPDHQR